MKSRTWRLIGGVVLSGGLALGGTALAVTIKSKGLATDACPGTVVCPLTGERICADRCPIDGEAADDCPGTIVCPLDGETICKDRCPLADQPGAERPRTACCPPAAEPRSEP